MALSPIYYRVTHLTIYRYSQPITDSVMEVRMQPRNDTYQRGLRFQLDISPSVKTATYRDYLGNTIQTFDIPAPHKRLAIKADAIVEVKPRPALPQSLPESAWDALNMVQDDRELFDMLLPGPYTATTELLEHFAEEVDWRRRADPLTLLRELNTNIYRFFEYEQHVTKVDSPIDIALKERRGVCQDFTHIMLTLGRSLGIPCRYVSGYLFHQKHGDDRSDEDASHAWVEAWLPELGWVGFDPTNNLIVSDRHISVGIANDYAGASPSRGVFKGSAETELEVSVHVQQLEELPAEDADSTSHLKLPETELAQEQQQQQQQ